MTLPCYREANHFIRLCTKSSDPKNHNVPHDGDHPSLRNNLVIGRLGLAVFNICLKFELQCFRFANKVDSIESECVDLYSA